MKAVETDDQIIEQINELEKKHGIEHQDHVPQLNDTQSIDEKLELANRATILLDKMLQIVVKYEDK